MLKDLGFCLGVGYLLVMLLVLLICGACFVNGDSLNGNPCFTELFVFLNLLFVAVNIVVVTDIYKFGLIGAVIVDRGVVGV